MRKIKKPKLTVKPREIFYCLKRNQKLGDLTEETIEELAGKLCSGNLLDPGCLYENIPANEAQGLGMTDVRGTLTLAITTLGDRGYEERLKTMASSGQAREKEVVWAWGQTMLAKLTDFTTGLIQKEAAAEMLEIGSPREIDPSAHQAVFDTAWSFLGPEEKIGVRRAPDPLDQSPKIWPIMTKVWTLAWITKKEKKLLEARS